ncbi:MAG TPA: TIGR02300 family protein [Ferrovibrio sp.]|uniref:TIGR02300 family protein n=1 Tax=Ferrovibrio sp. TaxID=1917215 RepID=UPI002ED2B354
MAKPEWGTKRRCLSCSAAFYDMGKTPILCPKCGAEFNPEILVKSRRPAKPEEIKPVKAPGKSVPDIAVDTEVEDEDIGDDLLEDADEFEEEDVAEEIDVEAESDSDEGH